MNTIGGPKVLSDERRQLILKELILRGSLNAAEFAKRLGTTGMTIRRDLAALADEGMLRRVHGGAVPVPAGQSGRPDASRQNGRKTWTTIGMVVPSAGYYFPGVIRGAEAAANESGARLVLGVSNYSPAEERRQVKRLFEHGVDGVLVTPSEASLAGSETLMLLAEAKIPVVVVERSIDDVQDPGRLESVRSDHVRGAEIAVDHLLALGHEKVALCLRESSPTAGQLVEGFHRALRHSGKQDDPHLVRTVSRAQNDPQAHRRVVDEILDWCVEEGVTAALVHTDEDALQFASSCQERRIGVPEDFAIIAYDDEVAALGAVALTAVAPPKFDVGYQALLMCLNRISSRRGASSALQRVNLSPSLVIRDSTQT